MNTPQSFTPGPWAPQFDRVMSADWLVQVCTNIAGDSDDQKEANARLIAAAPDLLNALEALVNAHDVKMGRGAVKLRLDIARAVIAKATNP